MALGAVADIARNLFYLFALILVAYVGYSLFNGGWGTPVTFYIAAACFVAFVVWRASKSRLA